MADKDYFYWLCNIIDPTSGIRGRSYYFLLQKLFNKEFYFIIPMDRNRAADGIRLRSEYIDETARANDFPACIDGPCRVLEMLVALALRWEEDIMAEPDFGNRTPVWFWEMITNLGFGSYHDRNYSYRIDDIINEALDRLLERDYEPTGLGGLFPLREPRKDQRDVEIWYQMSYYIKERHYFEEDF